MEEVPTKTLIISYFARFLGVFLILFGLMAAYLGLSMLNTVTQEGSIGTALQLTPDGNGLVVTRVEKESSGALADLQLGDTIVSVNGVKVTKEYKEEIAIPQQSVGSKVTFVVKSKGTERSVELEFVKTGVFDKMIGILFKIIPSIIMLLYVLVGFWGLMRSPYSTETILIALFCFCFGCFNYATVSTGLDPDNFVRKYLYFDEIKKFISIIMWFGPSFWLLLFATFPRRNRFYDRNKAISLLFIFLLPALVIATFVFIQTNSKAFGYTIFTLIFFNMGLGVFLLSNSVRRSESMLEKRQTRLMLFGIKYGALSIGLGWIEVLIFQLLLADRLSSTLLLISFLVFLLCQIGGLIIPFTFLNSFFHNKLLETESALKRRVRYVMVTFGLLAVYLSIIFFIGHSLVSYFQVHDTAVTIIVVLLLSLTFTPLNKKLLRWVDERFYPERTKYAEALKNFIQDITAQIDSSDILRRLADWTRSTLGIYLVIPVPVDGQLAIRSPFRSDRENSVLNKIRNGSKFFWDEVSAKYSYHIEDDEIEWARENDISLSIPMISQGELLGVLNVGKKQGEDDFSMDDIDLLSQASTQTALALQNIKLQSEYIEKKRMDKELEMARKIQRNLMPSEIPPVDGLDVHGESTPCFEVAGDYYDVIRLDDGNTVLVLADVSGKGAGAAMIMANLQASIRLGVQFTDNLSGFVKRINNLIYNNTSPSEFITLFCAVWDYKSKTLYYVNAGHNPPVAIDQRGNITKLDATGLIIGVLPDQEYTVRSIKLIDGTVVVIYTDGLDEAMNKSGVQFGIDRIIESASKNMKLSAAELAHGLNQDLKDFIGSTPLHDDVTLIIAKGL